MKNIDQFNKWILNKKSFSFSLPSGFEGRPFDNCYYDIGLNKFDEFIVIKLDDSIEFLIFGNFFSFGESSSFKISGFERLEYRINGVLVKEFKFGDLFIYSFG